jgi:hypothetical protein
MKTIIEMAREAGLKPDGDDWGANVYRKAIEAFAELVRADEREACAKMVDYMASRCNDIRAAALESASENIRARRTHD